MSSGVPQNVRELCFLCAFRIFLHICKKQIVRDFWFFSFFVSPHAGKGTPPTNPKNFRVFSLAKSSRWCGGGKSARFNLLTLTKEKPRSFCLQKRKNLIFKTSQTNLPNSSFSPNVDISITQFYFVEKMFDWGGCHLRRGGEIFEISCPSSICPGTGLHSQICLFFKENCCPRNTISPDISKLLQDYELFIIFIHSTYIP